MAPTFSYRRLPMDENCKGDGRQGQKCCCSCRTIAWPTSYCLIIISIITIAILSGFLIVFVVKNKACGDLQQVEMKDCNATRMVANEDSLKTCNNTVENLKMEKTQCWGQVKELEGEINTLNRTLQSTREDMEQLKKENEHLKSIKSKDNYEPDSGISMKPGQLLLLLLLLLQILEALLL